jgi:hypothetical protein
MDAADCVGRASSMNGHSRLLTFSDGSKLGQRMLSLAKAIAGITVGLFIQVDALNDLFSW